MPDNTAPYVGPRPFEESESKVFFGRGMEVNELVSLITAHPVVVLYAQSGAGKTSLVKAGLIPVLVNEEKFDVLPPMRVREQVTPNTNLTNIANTYMFNALAGARHAKDGGLVSNAFALEGLAKMSLSDFLRERTVASGEMDAFTPTVVIFDQFEEIFTLYPEHWEQRQHFFEQIAEALGRDSLLRVLFSMREDFIAELDPYASCLPEKLRTRFRIERLNKRTGLAAITEPLQAVGEASGRVAFAPGADEELIDNLLMVKVKTAEGTRNVKGKFIEPLQLQVVCQTLWNNLKHSDKLITREHLMAFGDVDKALSIFYESAIAKTAEVCGVKESVLRGWCQDKLITPAGTRATVFRGSEQTAGLKNDAVAELEKQSLLRIELRGGAQWYELTHDRFVEVIQQSNQKWIMERPAAEQTLLRLEEKAQEWGHDRDDSRLLDEVELLEAERWLSASEATELEPSKNLLALVRESRESIEFRQQKEAAERQRVEEQAKTADRFRKWSYGLAVLSLLAVVSLGLAIWQWWSAYKLKLQAQDQKVQAEEQTRQLKDAQDRQQTLTSHNTSLKENLDRSAKVVEALNKLQSGDLTGAASGFNAILNGGSHDSLEIADAHRGLARVDFESAKPRYREAVANYDKALKVLGYDGQGKLDRNIDVSRDNQSKFQEKAASFLREKGELYMSWGTSLRSSTDPVNPRALEKYNNARAFYRLAKGLGGPGAALAENGIAKAQKAIDDFKAAKETLDQQQQPSQQQQYIPQ